MGLLDQMFAAPDSAPALGLLGAGLMAGNAPAGFQSAIGLLAGSKDRELERQLRTMQIGNMQSEIDARKAALEKQNSLMEMGKRILARGQQLDVQPGQLGSGTFGIMPTAPGVPSVAANPQPRGFGGADVGDLAAFRMAGGPDLLPFYKAANEGFERKPGSFYDIPGKGRVFIPDVKSGMDYQGGRISAIPGYADFLTQQTLATEAPKTLLSSAANVNLRKNADGTESPVSSLAENPTLQNVLGGVFGRPMAPMRTPLQVPAAAPAVPRGPLAQPGDADRTAILTQELTAERGRLAQLQQRPDATPDMIRASQANIAELTKQLGGSSAPAPQGISYGKTTAQETTDAANAEYQKKVAADVVDQRKSIMNAGMVAPQNIARYQQIGKLLQDVDGGTLTPTGTHIASLANSLGLKIDKNLPNKEAAASLANQAALELRNPAGGAGMPGALSDSDRNFLTSMTPNMAQTAQGRAQIINSYVAVQQRNQQVAQFARNYEKKYGRLDNGFFEQLQSWSDAHPIFGGK